MGLSAAQMAGNEDIIDGMEKEAQDVYKRQLVRFKTRLMAIPAKLSPILSKKKDQTEIFKLLKRCV